MNIKDTACPNYQYLLSTYVQQNLIKPKGETNMSSIVEEDLKSNIARRKNREKQEIKSRKKKKKKGWKPEKLLNDIYEALSIL